MILYVKRFPQASLGHGVKTLTPGLTGMLKSLPSCRAGGLWVVEGDRE